MSFPFFSFFSPFFIKALQYAINGLTIILLCCYFVHQLIHKKDLAVENNQLLQSLVQYVINKQQAEEDAAFSNVDITDVPDSIVDELVNNNNDSDALPSANRVLFLD